VGERPLPSPEEVCRRLDRHLRDWLGAWPPQHGGITVVGSPRRDEPGWDGVVRSLAGLRTREGTVVSVPPDCVDEVRDAAGHAEGVDDLLEAIPALLGRPEAPTGQGVFRFATSPPDLGEVGEWVPADDARVPPWLRPFGGQVLVVFDGDGGAVAGLGVKRHDDVGREVAVATEEAWRGRGLARALVARAARRILAEGGVPVYLHGPANAASARVADAAGFPDRGWWILGLPTAT
jgi:GNAT superfamily N-acetyltransferase